MTDKFNGNIVWKSKFLQLKFIIYQKLNWNLMFCTLKRYRGSFLEGEIYLETLRKIWKSRRTVNVQLKPSWQQ